jgi:UDP-N-acetylmuramoyl-L-alanyl-D-glutamate--2,6-diaminopimelate ligase
MESLMRLKTLLQDVKNITVKGTGSPIITGITTFSKAVKPQELYVAFKGHTFDGRDFIDEAIRAHAAGVITDIYNPLLDKKFIQIITKDPKALGMELSLKFYQKVDALIGVTGTNGKTTTSFLIQQLFNSLGLPCGLVGTCHVDNLVSVQTSSLTTPDGLYLARLIHESKLAGAKALVTEVSSHALDQKRIYGHKFHTVIFTNLTHDHLDYHKTFEAYGESKLKLFLKDYQDRNKGYAVINIDDPFSKTILDSTTRDALTYSLKDHKATLFLNELNMYQEGMQGILNYNQKKYNFSCGLVGEYNASNLLASIGAALVQGVDIETILAQLNKLQGAPGRLEKITNNIYIDYAHTPDGLVSVLSSLKKLPFKKIRIVFGCGGDRDKQKRPIMGKTAIDLADEVIVTSDNPRTESPESIIRDILEGMSDKQKVKVIVDRKEALQKACEALEDDTLLLVAGKGHEKTQTIGHVAIPFDERSILEKCLSQLK